MKTVTKYVLSYQSFNEMGKQEDSNYVYHCFDLYRDRSPKITGIHAIKIVVLSLTNFVIILFSV